MNKQQKELREQRSVTELIFNHSQDAILFFENGIFTECNASAVKMFDYASKEDLLSHSISDFSPTYQPDGELSSKKAEKMMAIAFDNGVQRFEWISRTSTGEEFWVEITLTPIDVNYKNIVHVIWKDISKQKRLEDANARLTQSLERKINSAMSNLKKSQTQAKLGSWEFNIQTDAIVCSDEIFNIFEIPHNMTLLSYQAFVDAIHPDDKKRVDKTYKDNRKIKKSYEIIHRIVVPSGIKYVKKQCETTFDSKGKALLLVGTIQDITDEQSAKEELEQKNEMLFRQSRLAQMGEMISMIAHQWRQPLNAISLTTASLQLKIDNDHYDEFFFKSRLHRVSNYVQHLSLTIEDFRNFFKQNKVKEELTFDKVIENTLLIIGIELENNSIEIESHSQTHGKMYSYYNELLQVTLNIIKNARDALLETEVKKPKIIIRTYSIDDDKVVLEIEDNAGGVDKAIMDKIFEPYYTTKNEHEGTGLGLYISKIIIEEHCAGVLSVTNGEYGAIFKIVLNRNI
ncbi:MAG: PAS domain S-box protein [Sulfurovum sp.]